MSKFGSSYLEASSLLLCPKIGPCEVFSFAGHFVLGFPQWRVLPRPLSADPCFISLHPSYFGTSSADDRNSASLTLFLKSIIIAIMTSNSQSL